jgi:hypothetical protein
MERSYRNLGYVFLVLLPIFVAGFWIPYFSEIPHFDETITMAVHVHAASLFCFLLLLIVQPLAIRYRAISTHRILGRFSNIVIPTALISSVAMLWKEYHEHLTDGETVAAFKRGGWERSLSLSASSRLFRLCEAHRRNDNQKRKNDGLAFGFSHISNTSPVTRNGDLTVASDYADRNRLALAI